MTANCGLDTRVAGRVLLADGRRTALASSSRSPCRLLAQMDVGFAMPASNTPRNDQSAMEVSTTTFSVEKSRGGCSPVGRLTSRVLVQKATLRQMSGTRLFPLSRGLPQSWKLLVSAFAIVQRKAERCRVD